LLAKQETSAQKNLGQRRGWPLFVVNPANPTLVLHGQWLFESGQDAQRCGSEANRNDHFILSDPYLFPQDISGRPPKP